MSFAAAHIVNTGWAAGVQPRRIAERIAFAGFLVLFPGFAVYHYAVASGLMPAIVGGLFGVAALVLAGVAVLLGGWLLGKDAWGGLPQAQFVMLSLAFLLAWSLAAALSLGDAHYSGDALIESAGTLVLWLGVFFVASFCRVESRPRRALLVLAAVALVVVLVAAMMERSSFLGLLLLFGDEVESGQPVSTYQGVGRSVLVTAMMLAALTPVHARQLVVLACATLLLTALGSRAHLFTAALLVMLVLALALLRARRRGAAMLFLAIAGAAVYASWSVFLGTRAGEILDLASSTSWVMRMEVQSLALEVIRAHPLLGDFGYHLREIGPGGYAHNALSAWPQFGLPGFLLYVGLIGYFAVLSVRRALSTRGATTAWRMAVLTNVAALLLVATAEPVFSVLPPLGWGFAVSALFDERARRTQVSYAA